MKFHNKFKSTVWINLFLVFTIFYACTPKEESKQKISDVILNESDSFFYVDTSAYPKQRSGLPIGVFDSGTGGLTVLDAIVNFDHYNNSTKDFQTNGDSKRDFQEEYFIYFGDQANMPYGNYSKENKVDLLKEHIIKDVQFLLSDKYYTSPTDDNFSTNKQPVKAIVVACNTATAYGLEDIKNFMSVSGLNLPVIGVIDAGVKAALSGIDKNENSCVAIMATAGTVSSNGYVNTLNYWKEKLGYTSDISTFQQAGIGLAGAIDGSSNYIDKNAKTVREEYKGPSLNNSDAKIDKNIISRYGFSWDANELLFEGSKTDPTEIQLNSVPNYIKYHVVSLLENIRKSNTKNKLSSVILGCTHYPFYTDLFSAEFNRLYNYKENGNYIYRDYMTENISLIDPAVNTSKELYEYLSSKNMFNESDIFNSEFYISTANSGNKNNKIDSSGNFFYDYKYGREEGFIQEYVKSVPFSAKSINDEIADRLKTSIPFTYELIKEFNSKNEKLKFLKEEEKL